MKKIFIAMSTILLVLFFVAIPKDRVSGEVGIKPQITSLSPSPIYVTKAETELTINGEGFGNEGNLVTGGGDRFNILSWSDTKIVVKVSKNRPLGIGQQQIVVNNSSSPFPLLVKQAVCDTEEDWACTGWGSCSTDGHKTRVCTQEYECDTIGIPPETSQICKPRPSITSLSPSDIHKGAVITILGNSFGNDCNKTDFYCGVKVNQELYKISSSDWSDASIKFTVPFNAESGYFQIVDTKGQQSNQFGFTIAPLCTSWTYSDWSACPTTGQQTRTVASSSPAGCTDGSPILSQSCVPPPLGPKITSVNPATIHLGDQVEIIGENFGDNKTLYNGRLYDLNGGTPQQIISWSNSKIRAVINLKEWNKTTNTALLYIRVLCLDERGCESFNGNGSNIGDDVVSNVFSIKVDQQSCTEDKWSCGDWNACSTSGTQTRACTKTFDCPTVNTLSPATTQKCIPLCSSDTWSCGSWSACSISGNQTRSCAKTFDCSSVETPSPATSQSCTPPQPTCTSDTWTCGGWDTCSLSGIQNRSCAKIFDCPSVETAPPTTAQYCEAPNRPLQQVPQDSSDEISNQDAIVRSTVKLLCPVDTKRASQGSGTVIDPSGTILTNKHVIAGTPGCLVGFIDEFNDEPYFGDRQIADIVKESPNQDFAILKIRNPQNQRLMSVDIKKGRGNLRLGTRVTTYGYPAKFGTKITYTSGDFSGTDGSYIKTTAILEYGNSGGGAYLKDGTFIGVPSAVVKGELNALGYILSIDTINAWLGNSSTVLGGSSNNRYSRVSVLEDIDLKTLDSLKLFIPQTDASGNLVVPVTPATSQKTKQNFLTSIVASLNIRESPSSSAKVVSGIKKGVSYPIIEVKKDWYKIQVSKKLSGWVMKKFVKLVPSR